VTSEETLKSGNTFARGLLLAFSIVYALYITAEHPIDNRVIGIIGQHRADLQSSLTDAEIEALVAARVARADKKSSVRSSVAAAARSTVGIVKIAPSSSVPTPPGVPTPSNPTLLKVIELREKIVKTYLDEATARKAADVQYNVPGLPGSFSEKTVVLLFPLITFAAILRLWGYRRALLKSRDTAVSEYPFWAAPFCRPASGIGFGRWLLLNTVGLTIVTAICALTLEYILDTKVRLLDPIYQSFSLISTGLGIVCIIIYSVALIRAMCRLI
jgi:hypothetical protein